MTQNAFIFSWDQLGVEAIVPITQYEHHDKQNLIRLLKDQRPIENPINNIVYNLTMRARFNPQRHYEIYAIDCDKDITADAWRVMWETCPQETADLVRARGHKIYSDRANKQEIKIT